ncbi:tRNA-dihydrouridine synthase B [Candidatus Lokiarchaeum ossiferum]|uniref:tRNA-dihydrouridine synthase B n=1 Tax=Candidatus Lokiarchaeum ossiferum TaxID=2951803 RepID=A0ABY6HNX5_9ARCH|nr:tRNA-dihydrouridine synthase B [Candidatus Lokiarchaeum sp. B-35]
MTLRIKDIFPDHGIKAEKKCTQSTLAFAPLEPYSANPLIRELMGLNGAQLLFRPKILPQHLLKAKEWQFWEKIKHITKIKTPSGKKVYDGIQLIARPDDPIRPAVEFINANAKKMEISFIDLNFCCPGYKVLPQKRGGELLKTPDLVIKVISRVLKYSDLPISMKIRKGYNQDDNPIELCRRIRKEFGKNIGWISLNRAPVKMAGVNMQHIQNDLSSFQEAYKAVEGVIPILANGGISDVCQLQNIVQNTNVSGIMIGRAAMGNSRIFYKASQFFQPNLLAKDWTIEQELQNLFLLVNKYKRGPSGRWVSIGNLKRILFFYIKAFYERRSQQIPKGYGFSKWNQTSFSKESLIATLINIFPSIPKLTWQHWLAFL